MSVRRPFGTIASGLDAGWDTMYAAYVDRHGVMTASATHRWVVDGAWTPGEGDLVDIVDAEVQENGPLVGRVFLFTVGLEWPQRTMNLTAEYYPHPDSSDPQWWNSGPDFPFESTFELR